MWISATCTNTTCPENGVEKLGEFDSLPENVSCGFCGEPCTLVADVSPPPPSDEPTMQERLAELEAFNTQLIAALSSIFNPADPADGSQFAALIQPAKNLKGAG